MANYKCRLVSSFLMYMIAVILLSMGLATYGWYEIDGQSFNFAGQWQGYQYQYTSNNADSHTVSTNGYATAIFITIILAIASASLCLILSFVMFCADCCCHITKCMTVIPKIITACATLAGLLADSACVVFLIELYVYLNKQNIIKVDPIPSYSFFLVALTGIFLMIAGCITSGVKHATVVEDSEIAVQVMVSGSQSQSQGTSSYVNTPQNMFMGAGPFYQPQPMTTTNPAPVFNDSTAAYRQIAAKIFITNNATQTSMVNVRKGAN